MVTAAAATALMGAGQAFAGVGENLDSYYQDSVWAYSHGTNGAVAVADTAGDSHAVYTLYDRRNNSGLRLDNHDGNGSTPRPRAGRPPPPPSRTAPSARRRPSTTTPP
ncbi:hypothetical protein ACWD5B_22965, partial [Streptomyces tanashiensis]